MTIILCITITANTFHNKTIFEFRILIDQNDDQFLYLLFFFFHYSLFLFYISVLIHKIHVSITSISDVFSIYLFRQVSIKINNIVTLTIFFHNIITKQFETLHLFAFFAIQNQNSKSFCFRFSTSSFFRKF